MLARGGWAPILLVGLHIVFEYALGIYREFPLLDLPMHFAGGMAIAYFSSSCFAALPETDISPRLRPKAEFVFAIAITATAAILWEIMEFIFDVLFATHMFGSQYDTLLDMSLGMSGALTMMLLAAASGSLGIIRPIE